MIFIYINVRWMNCNGNGIMTLCKHRLSLTMRTSEALCVLWRLALFSKRRILVLGEPTEHTGKTSWKNIQQETLSEPGSYGFRKKVFDTIPYCCIVFLNKRRCLFWWGGTSHPPQSSLHEAHLIECRPAFLGNDSKPRYCPQGARKCQLASKSRIWIDLVWHLLHLHG